jgi:hypothetical protein
VAARLIWIAGSALLPPASSLDDIDHDKQADALAFIQNGGANFGSMRQFWDDR